MSAESNQPVDSRITPFGDRRGSARAPIARTLPDMVEDAATGPVSGPLAPAPCGSCR